MALDRDPAPRRHHRMDQPRRHTYTDTPSPRVQFT